MSREWDAFGCAMVLAFFGMWLAGFLMGMFLT